uniref:(northern house mosquito) hypothetical protein n=1 Tax=Culex pipiens TaxID=7175 RepID=A0A8D8GRR7_CULPI
MVFAKAKEITMVGKRTSRICRGTPPSPLDRDTRNTPSGKRRRICQEGCQEPAGSFCGDSGYALGSSKPVPRKVPELDNASTSGSTRGVSSRKVQGNDSGWPVQSGQTGQSNSESCRRRRVAAWHSRTPREPGGCGRRS